MDQGEIAPEVSDAVIFWGSEGRYYAAIIIAVDDFDDPDSLLTVRVLYPYGEATYHSTPRGAGLMNHWSWPEEARAIRRQFAGVVAA